MRLTVIAGLVVVASASATAQAQTGWGQPTQPPPAEPGLQAGGLAPPGSGSSSPSGPPSQTEQVLAEADRKDTQRGLQYFWLTVEGGLMLLDTSAFQDDHLLDPDTGQGLVVGPMLGAGLGLRILFFTVGPRFRYCFCEDLRPYTLAGEVGVRFPLGKLEPHAHLGGGYASVALDEASREGLPGDVRVRGWEMRVGGGLDYFLSRHFSLGALLAMDALFLRRPKLAAADAEAAPSPSTREYSRVGRSIGGAFTSSLALGLHF